MQRRTWLALGAVSAAALALGGGSLALMKPGVANSHLTGAGREIFAAVGGAILEGTLPPKDPQRQSALGGLLDRVDALVAALPPHAQAELSQLLALLASGAGRRALAGVSQPWPAAGIADIQQGLQAMRLSRLGLRRQAYQALHDIVGAAYFSDAQTWGVLGYPGPLKIEGAA